MKVPEKGSIEWIKLAEFTKRPLFADVEVAVRHVGPKIARQWSYRSMQDNIDESKRLADTRRDYSREAAPELWEDALTPEGAAALEALTATVFQTAVTEVRGNGLGTLTGEQALEVLEYLDLGEASRLMAAIMQMQSLKREQFSPPSHSSDVGAEPAAARPE